MLAQSPTAELNVPLEELPSAPSPASTDIIPPDLSPEDTVADTQRLGITVRDFAYDASVPVAQRAPELFDPVLAWHVYESVLDSYIPRRGPLNARNLRRLLDLGWVSPDADGHRWQTQDAEALAQFDARPHYPWTAFKLAKPRKEELVEVATSRFRWVNADQLVPQFVHRGVSRLTARFRGAHKPPMPYPKRPCAISATETDPELGTLLQFKKRRLSTSAASESQPSPSASATRPSTSVDGGPPQQPPAGESSDDPPGHSALPTAGALTSSLQRRLSLTSQSPRCATDCSQSDSRTPFIHATHPE